MQLFHAVVLLGTVQLLQYSACASINSHPVSGWVNHLRIGDVIFAKSSDKQQMSDYLQEMSYHDDGTTCFKSSPSKVAEDGPLLDISEQTRQKRDLEYDDYDTQEYKCLREVDRVFYYPEFAVGKLENGCTAFLVGPYHALTTAKCVYDFNNRLWEKKLDFLRAQNGTKYLQKMDWKEVFIPREFFEQNSDEFDWALILFDKTHPSPVWHPFMYCPSKCPGHYSTAYGYINDSMVLKECEVFEQVCHEQVEMQCCQNDIVNFHGGPVFGGYGFDGSKILPVSAISTYSTEKMVAESNEIAEEEIIFDRALKIHSEMFWTVCMLMENSGFDSDCKKL